MVFLERLRIGVDGDELHAGHAFLDHPIEGVAAAAADADDFHARGLSDCFFQFEDHGSLGPSIRRSPAAIA